MPPQGWRFACRQVRIDWQSPTSLSPPMAVSCRKRGSLQNTDEYCRCSNNEGQLALAEESRRVLEALALPEEFGGLDLSLIELGLIAFQAGRSLAGAPSLTSSCGAARRGRFWIMGLTH